MRTAESGRTYRVRAIALAIVVSLLALACSDESRGAATVVATAPAPPAFTPTPMPTSTPGPEPVPLTPAVSRIFWEEPQPGWVFVLDTVENDLGVELRAQLLLVDPTAREVRGRLWTGGQPHAALSPDGSTLFLAMEGPARGEPELTAIDTTTGGVRWTTTLHPIQTSIPSRLRHMEVSADGSLLYVAAYSETTRELRPTVIDAASGRELTADATREACSLAMFVRPPSGSGMLGRCENGVFEYGVGAESGARVETPLDLEIEDEDPDAPVVQLTRVTTWGVNSPRQVLYVATGDGRIATVDLAADTVTIRKWHDLGFDERTRFPGEIIVPFAPLLVSPDGGRLYVPIQERPCGYCAGNLSGTAIEVRDTETFELLGRIEPSTAVTEMALSPEGDRLYLVAIDVGPLVVIDTTAFEEVASIEIGARTPATLLVLPDAP